MMRRVKVTYERERLELSDGDFVDLDWVDRGSRKLVILSHGLEGNSDRHYIRGAARLFARRGWDVLAWNCRSCSGEMNRHLRLYNHGEIGDIGEVIAHALRVRDYQRIVLIGYSMGGSITLKYLGVNGAEIPEPVKKGIAISTPCDLKASAQTLEDPANRFYKKRFLKNLRKKIAKKAEQFPEVIDLSHFDRIEVWEDFDNFYSAPLNGYRDADDFYQQASAINFMDGITVPALVLNAKNDPILTPACSPAALAEKHPNIFVETPEKGGHVGFSLPGDQHAWSEYRALEFAGKE